MAETDDARRAPAEPVGVGPERRLAARYAASEPVEIEVPRSPREPVETWSGILINASCSGVALRLNTDRADWMEKIAGGSLAVRMVAESIMIRGRVAWCSTTPNGFLCGLELDARSVAGDFAHWINVLKSSAEKTLAGPKAAEPLWGATTENTTPARQQPAQPQAPSLPAPLGEREELFGRYRLRRRLARGGMAEVFEASYSPNPDFDKLVALKRILPNRLNDREFVQMFRREARIASQLAHANIVQVFDFGQVEGVWFLAMEYVDGYNLDLILRRLNEKGQRLPLDLGVYIAREIVRGLSYAHNVRDRRGSPLSVIHRDLNPPNILISRNGEVKIADFGVAQVYPDLAAGDDFRGKVSYLAPEVVRGDPLDQRADLWALGVMLHELFTGEKPLGLGSGPDIEKLKKILEDPHESIRLEVPDMPIPLVAATDMLLSKDPADRPADADEIGVILDTVLEPGVARLLPPFLTDLFPEA